MLRLKTVIPIIVAAPLLIYGGIKGYTYYVIRNQLEDIIGTVSPFAAVSYGGIGSSVKGTVRVEQIRVVPHGVPDAIRIDAAELHTPGLLFLLRDSATHRRKGFPERLEVVIRGLHLELGGPIMAGLTSRSEDRSHDGDPRVDGLACGWRTLFAPEGLRDLGYTTLSYDVDLLMRLPGNADELVLRFDARAHDLQHLYLETRLAGVVATLAGADTAGLRMRTLAMRYELDPGYVHKAVDRCATKSELRVDTLLERLAGQDDASYMTDLGFVPGPGIRRALVSFFSHPREIRVSAKPPWAVDLGTPERYRPQDLPDRLKLTVSLDSDEISDLSFTTVSLREPGERRNLSALAAPSSSETARKARSKDRGGSDTILRNGVSYQRVDQEQLPELVGRDIWVLTRKGLERQGRLVKVEGGRVWLTLTVRGGSMTTSVALSETEKLGLRKARR